MGLTSGIRPSWISLLPIQGGADCVWSRYTMSITYQVLRVNWNSNYEIWSNCSRLCQELLIKVMKSLEFYLESVQPLWHCPFSDELEIRLWTKKWTYWYSRDYNWLFKFGLLVLFQSLSIVSEAAWYIRHTGELLLEQLWFFPQFQLVLWPA